MNNSKSPLTDEGSIVTTSLLREGSGRGIFGLIRVLDPQLQHLPQLSVCCGSGDLGTGVPVDLQD